MGNPRKQVVIIPMPPNTACTRLVGVCAFSGSLRGLELVPSKWRCLVPPTSGYRLLHLSSAEINLPGSSSTRTKNKICRSSPGSRADLLFATTDLFFLWECCATPVSLSFVPGLQDLLFVDPGTCYALKPSSVIRARTSSFAASLLATFLRTKRVMSVSTPNFIRAYLANCL